MNDLDWRNLRAASPAERDVTRAIRQSLEGETLTLKWLLRNLRSLQVIRRKLVRASTDPALALDWWKGERAFPAGLQFLGQLISRGLPPPVFCTLSLCLSGLAPSLHVLVPYEGARHGVAGFRDTFWLNPPEHADLDAPASSWRTAARVLSHAILNIAYSARLADDPLLGWLAFAHNRCLPIYIPDVTQVPQLGPVTSAAIAEEPFLAMASVLYLPLRHGDLPVLRHLGAQAVLMLWSPAPGHWDGLKSRPLDRGVHQITDPDLLPDELSRHFTWLPAILMKNNETQAIVTTQFFHIIFSIARQAEQRLGSEEAKSFLKRLCHEMPNVLRLYMQNQHIGPCPALAPWIKSQLSPPMGFTSILAREWGDVPRALESLARAVLTLECRRPRGSAPRERAEVLLAEPDAILSRIDGELTLGIPGSLAEATLRDAVNDLASDSAALHAVSLDLSEAYCGLSLRFEPTREARQRLYGSATSFERYFGTRRGLVVSPAGPDSSGFGLALHTRLAAAFGMYRRLYVSPDGEKWRVDLAVPIERVRPPQVTKEI